MSARTFAIGDIHGELEQLDLLLARLPEITSEDTLVFVGDYVDRGPQSKQVVERVRGFVDSSPAKVVLLRGNHEDAWHSSYPEPEPTFMLTRGNGCLNTFRSYIDGPPLEEDEEVSEEEFLRFIDVTSWMPEDVVEWMGELRFWYEDEHAIYVHAGLEGDGSKWLHPRDAAPGQLLRMREPDFFTNYEGKRLIFGHTPTVALPVDHLGPIRRLFDDPTDVWRRGDLFGIDTGCGKGGFLSAVEFPRRKIYESR
jgi:serine/threonine protein phosphatase 1